MSTRGFLSSLEALFVVGLSKMQVKTNALDQLIMYVTICRDIRTVGLQIKSIVVLPLKHGDERTVFSKKCDKKLIHGDVTVLIRIYSFL